MKVVILTFPADFEEEKKKRIQTIETKLDRISYFEYKPTTGCGARSAFLVGPLEPLLATVKRQKLAWSRHAALYDSISKTTLHWKVDDAVAGR